MSPPVRQNHRGQDVSTANTTPDIAMDTRIQEIEHVISHHKPTTP